MNVLGELRHKMRQSAEKECFAEYAEQLRLAKKYSASIRVCLEGLSHNPNEDRGRLVLARTYYDCGYIAFSLRELNFLSNRHPDNVYIKRLVEKLSLSKTNTSDFIKTNSIN